MRGFFLPIFTKREIWQEGHFSGLLSCSESCKHTPSIYSVQAASLTSGSLYETIAVHRKNSKNDIYESESAATKGDGSTERITNSDKIHQQQPLIGRQLICITFRFSCSNWCSHIQFRHIAVVSRPLTTSNKNRIHGMLAAQTLISRSAQRFFWIICRYFLAARFKDSPLA